MTPSRRFALMLLAAGDPLVRGAELVRVVDGDTFMARIQLWPDPQLELTISVRVAGVNAPDRGQGGYAEATSELTRILTGGPITLQAVRVDKYGGRVDAVVAVRPDSPEGGPVLAADELVDAAVAVRWDGHGLRPVVPWPPQTGPYAPDR